MRRLALGLITACIGLSSPAFAGPGQAIPIPYSQADAGAGAELRSHASVAVSFLFFPCSKSSAWDAPIARYFGIKDGLKDERHVIDLSIVEADFNYQMTLADVACADPKSPEAAQRDTLNIAVVESALDRLEKNLATLEQRTLSEGQ